MLGAGSAKLVEAYPNTGVAIRGKTALRGVIVLEKRLDGPSRLEIVVKGRPDTDRTRPLLPEDEKLKFE